MSALYDNPVPIRSGLRIAACVLVLSTGVLVAGTLQSTASPPPDSPLAAYPGFGHDTAADEARFDNEEQQREDMIAACMQQQGFQYTPEPALAADDSMTLEQAWESAQNGPNELYIASLTPTQWTSYSMALAGVPDANDPSSPSNSGCLHDAYTAILGVFAAYNALREPYEDMQDDIAKDTRIAAVEQSWSTCMQGSGYSYANTSALAADPDTWTIPPTTGPPGTEPEDADSSPDPVLDARWIAFETTISAGQSCEDQVGLQAVYDEVTIDHEAQFVQTYKDVLDSYQ